MPDFSRRAVLAGASLLPLAGCATLMGEPATPVVFVHGNGDTAALWHTTIWRWESAGYDPALLDAIDFPNPVARNVDATPQANRSGTDEQRAQLAAFVLDVKRRTAAPKVALVANSRGGNSIRHWLRNGDGGAHVSHAVLCGTPNHGVVVSETLLVGNEFNGKGAFLTGLNDGPNEVSPGVRWMTVRSDRNDKFAQADGRAAGFPPGTQTGVTNAGPELKGAHNVVIPGIDHRETGFHPLSFLAVFDFITGRPAKSASIVAEAAPVLNGKVNAMPGGVQTNMPVAGAIVAVWETDPVTGERRRMVHGVTTGADGLWGPFTASPTATYEFVVAAPGEAITHIYRSPFPRSSRHIHLRPARLTDADRAADSSVTISRPRGYFGAGRDLYSLDGQVAPGVPEGVATVSTSTVRPAGPPRTVIARFNDEVIATRSWPVAENRIVIAELHY